MPFENNITSVPYDTDAVRRLKERKQAKRSGRFVKGPLQWSWLAAAAKCHPRAVEVLLVIKMESDLSGKPEVTVSTELVADLGISPDTKDRALAALEKVGLISVKRRRGRLPRVRILP